MKYTLQEALENSKKVSEVELDWPEISVDFEVFRVKNGILPETIYQSVDNVDGTVKRRHSYSNFDPYKPWNSMAIMTNTIPSWVSTLSDGDDSDELSKKSFHNEEKNVTIGLVDLISKVFSKIEEEKKELGAIEMPLATHITAKSKHDLDPSREYILPEARVSSDGVVNCWHIYSAKDGTILALEHPHFKEIYEGITFYKNK
ncbi:hypothetical protein M1139_01860 [Candidatus Parvarchaeota archaeon]|nr:hypothetical protein [Candidatus Parvarchaeota archaeon]